MRHLKGRGARTLVAPLLVVLFALVLAAPAFALDPPWNAQPISHGLGPTYGEAWPAGSLEGEAVATMQGDPLALMPWAAVPTLLAQFQAEAAAAGVPARMTYSVLGQSADGRDIYEVVINALETPNQRRDYERWRELRSLMLSDPVEAQARLASYGDDVKMCAYQSHIHGREYEAVDANMQVIRDLTVTPRGTNPVVDKILDNEIVVVLMDNNPDGRVRGTRGNVTGMDPNHDFFVQSQPEQQIAVDLMHRWLPTGFIEGHGYVNPTLIDGCTLPHNPGVDPTFYHWNVQRIEQNRADFAATEVPGLASIVSPIRDWNEMGRTDVRTYTVAEATQTGTTVTITTAEDTILAPEYMVVIAGVPEAGYNGTFMVDEVISPTQFTYTTPTNGLADSTGGTVALPPQPNLAQTWDDWPPYYGQSYSALLGGPDGSTVEMTNAHGRLVAKQAQYIAFYSSNNFWVDHKAAMLRDHVGTFVRGVTAALPNPSAFDDDPVLSSRFFTDRWQNYAKRYPLAYIIPRGAPQRSEVEANNLVDWLLHNGVQVNEAVEDFEWDGTTYPAGSYVVWMAQPMRGIAWNALAAGVDLSNSNIRTLYASPGAWSHGLSWGADVVEVPEGDSTFVPDAEPVDEPSPASGGVRGGVNAPAQWYSVALKGVHEYPVIRSLLKQGVEARLAEAPFESASGGTMPAGSLIFPAGAKHLLDAAGRDGGVWFERSVGAAMPPTTCVSRPPRIAYLVTAVPATQSETTVVLDSVFGFDETGAQQPVHRLVTDSDWDYVATQDSDGPKGLNNPDIRDPLKDYDVIYTTLTAWPNAANYPLARERLEAFFERGGGFMTQNVTSAGFLAGAPSPLVRGTLTRTQSNAYGGIAFVDNVGHVTSPVTGSRPVSDALFLPQHVVWFSSLPEGAVVDQRFPASITSWGAENGFVAGLWNNRAAGADSGPVLIHGDTTLGGRYMFFATNAFSRADGQRQWLHFLQSALWSNLTDDVAKEEVTVTATADDKVYDGTRAATVTLSSDDIAADDDVTIGYASARFDSKDVGTGKTVTVTGISLSGADAGKYALTGQTATATADVTPAALTITADDQAKPFGTVFSFAGTEFEAAGLVAGDGVSLVVLTSGGAAAGALPGAYAITPSAAIGNGLANYDVTYVDGTMTVGDKLSVGPFAKPLRKADPRRFRRGATIRVAFKVKNVAGGAVTTTRPTLKLTRGGKVVIAAAAVKYQKASKLYVYNLKTRASWKLATYKVSVSLGAGATGRSVTFKLIR